MKLSEMIFVRFPNIEVFHMNNSNIAEISYSDFRKASYLTNLSLSHNIIEELPSFLFGSSWNLRYVDLSFNKIKVISADAFEMYKDRIESIPS